MYDERLGERQKDRLEEGERVFWAGRTKVSVWFDGAGFKDFGKKCFGFVKMDAGEIAGIKARV